MKLEHEQPANPLNAFFTLVMAVVEGTISPILLKQPQASHMSMRACRNTSWMPLYTSTCKLEEGMKDMKM